MRDQMSVQQNNFGQQNDFGQRNDFGSTSDHESQAQVPAAFRMSSARSRSGAITVVTTPQGLPTRVRIDRSQLEKRPDVLADEILRLCRQSAMAAGIRWRDELLEAGASRDVVDAMGLPTTDDLSRAEQLDDERDDVPASWLRRV
ncbi:hypothetical protein [Gordonia sputi]|uniref:Uncharacterized protein n=2 Tax=Gordoniaceae TaxID=85026 RepID=H5U592_9ACTN|nr:hypothetical protein [Gordonia sputi]GAB40900.1 hypothetical protein GOSPT_117_00230 [Gordonia sputi NBRC 100414]